MKLSDFVIDNDYVWFVGVLICVDVLTGIVKATKTHSIRSAILRNGGYKKFLILLVVCLAYALDKVFFNGETVYYVTCAYYVLNEAVSITENLGECGVPIPQKLKNVLEELRDNDEKG